jgi:hypothetical protein
MVFARLLTSLLPNKLGVDGDVCGRRRIEHMDTPVRALSPLHVWVLIFWELSMKCVVMSPSRLVNSFGSV